MNLRAILQALVGRLGRRTETGAEPSLREALARLHGMGLDPADANDIGKLLGAEMPTPEEYLGRPLTPDHIFNDPRFNHRMALTHDLDRVTGSVPPEQRLAPVDRFDVAGRRIAASLPPVADVPNDLSQWSEARASVLPILRGRQMGIDQRLADSGEEPITVEDILQTRHPEAMFADRLGDFGVGGVQEHTPLLSIAALIGGGLTLREALQRQAAQRGNAA